MISGMGLFKRWRSPTAPADTTLSALQQNNHGTPTPTLPTGLVHYRPRWKPAGYQAGLVSGSSAGMGDALRAVVPWLEYPDPRRLDIRATLRDPYEALWVRDFKRNTAINMIALVDSSASMAYHGVYARPQLVANLLAVLAQSAYAAGDAFGLLVAGAQIHPGLRLPPRIHRSAALWIARHWSRYQPQGQSTEAMRHAVAWLPKRQSLVFLISDFHWPDGQLSAVLKSLAHHDVVPLMLRDPAESAQLPMSGFARLADMEHCDQAFVWMNTQTKAWLQQRAEAHWQQVVSTCQRYGVQPHLVADDVQPQALTAYFLNRQ